MNVNNITGICLSDIHTLHRKTPTSHIIKSLNQLFYEKKSITDFLFHFWNGDIFDTSVEAKSEDLFLIKQWFKKYLIDCEKQDRIVRILEGTSLHDAGQAKSLLLVADYSTNIKYINTLTIEIFEEYDNLSVMYVPDNFGNVSTSNKTTEEYIYELALEELTRNNLKSVDLIMFHGGFDFQVRGMGNYHGHVSSQWEDITNYIIFSGHIHRPSNKGKIRGTGSFDRTAHGEEHSKGCWYWNLNKKEDIIETSFYINKNAYSYVTLDTTLEEESDKLLERIITLIEKINRKGRIRIRGGEGNIVKPIINLLKKQYLDVYFDEENSLSKSNLIINSDVYDDKKYEGITLTKENITSNLFSFLEETLNKSVYDKEDYEKVLKEYL